MKNVINHNFLFLFSPRGEDSSGCPAFDFSPGVTMNRWLALVFVLPGLSGPLWQKIKQNAKAQFHSATKTLW